MVDQCRKQVAKEEPQEQMEQMGIGENVKIEQANSRHKLHKSFSQEKNGGGK